MNFCVPIIARRQVNYIVDAESQQEANDKAMEMFREGEEPTTLGNEWEEIERVGVPTPVEEQP